MAKSVVGNLSSSPVPSPVNSQSNPARLINSSSCWSWSSVRSQSEEKETERERGERGEKKRENVGGNQSPGQRNRETSRWCCSCDDNEKRWIAVTDGRRVFSSFLLFFFYRHLTLQQTAAAAAAVEKLVFSFLLLKGQISKRMDRWCNTLFCVFLCRPITINMNRHTPVGFCSLLSPLHAPSATLDSQWVHRGPLSFAPFLSSPLQRVMFF